MAIYLCMRQSDKGRSEFLMMWEIIERNGEVWSVTFYYLFKVSVYFLIINQ